MGWRIGLKQQARRPPVALFVEVGNSNAAARTKHFPVIQDGADLIVSRHRPDVVARQTNDRAKFAQTLVEEVRIGEKLARERIDVRRHHGLFQLR